MAGRHPVKYQGRAPEVLSRFPMPRFQQRIDPVIRGGLCFNAWQDATARALSGEPDHRSAGGP
jgi:hypothetical protein